MRKRRFFILCVVAIMIGGCVPSLHELYTEDTLLFDEKLIGCWGEKEDEMWCFTRHEQEDAYDLVIREKEDKQSFLLARLVDLDGRRFLDLYPKEEVQLSTGDWYRIHLLHAHTFLKINGTDPNLVMAVMKPDAVSDLMKINPRLIRHERIEDNRVVFTAPPEQLQGFLKKEEVLEAVFGDPATLPRYKPKEE